MKRILITGGGGFIGTHLAERLCRDHEVVLLDSFRRDALSFAPGLRAHRNVRVVTADVRDAAAVSAAASEASVVIHLAAIAGVSSYYKEPLLTLETNILGTLNLLSCSARSGIEKLVYFSTSEVYGVDAMFVDENQPCSFGPLTDRRWVYATSKAAGENLCLRYAEQHGFRCVVIRPFNVYGPRQVGEGAICNFLAAAVKRQPLRVYGDGTAIRSWCYVDDAVQAVLAVLANDGFQGILNIGNPREIESTSGLARRVASLVPGATIEYHAVQRQEVRARVPDISLARSVLSWEPRVELDQGLRATLRWFQEEQAS